MKDVSKLFLFVIFSALLSGCAANKPNLNYELEKVLNEPLYCTGKEECRTMWERATYFVNSNAGFKIQILNENLIETYNPTQDSVRLAFKISREPLGDDRYQIWTTAWCNNIFGCQPHPQEAMARAKYYMKTGKRWQ